MADKLTCKIKATRSDDRALTPLGTRRCAAIAAVDTFSCSRDSINPLTS